MNKTVTVNISGFVFYIEEEAFNVLSTYLNRIKSIFQTEESSDEIIDDVEARIGELFKERLEVISKKLYRDPDDKILGGVSTGLGHYFGIDAVLVRIIFILVFLFGTAGGWIYIILWIVLPKAESTSEKLRMKGEPVTVDSIKKKINDIAGEEEIKKVSSGFQNFLETSGNIITVAAKVIGKLAAVFFSFLFGFMAISLLIGLIVILASPESGMNISGFDLDLNQIIDMAFPGTPTFYLLALGILLLFLAPIIGLLYLAIRILAGDRYKSKSLVLSIISALVIGLIMTSAGGISFAKHYKSHGDIEETDVISDLSIENLHVMMLEDDVFHSGINMVEHYHHNDLELVKLEDGYLYNGGMIELRTRSSASDNYSINIIKESQGRREIDAINYAENINYKMKIVGDTLFLSPYFFSPEEDKYRAQRIEIEIAVPDDKKITFDKNTRRINMRGVRSGKSYIYLDGRKEKEGFLEKREDSGHHKITIEKEDGNLEIDIETDIEDESKDKDNNSHTFTI